MSIYCPPPAIVYFGAVIGALPDGRKAGVPLSEGISPVQGADRNGPTAVTRSAAKIDHIRTGGTLLNQKFLPQVLADDTGITKLSQLVRTYFRMDGITSSSTWSTAIPSDGPSSIRTTTAT